MNGQETEHRHHSRLESLTRGRLRVKVHPRSRAPQLMQNLQRRLRSQEGIHDVSINPATGSVTVRYDHGRYSAAGILGVLEELDFVIDSTLSGGPTAPAGFLAVIDDLNTRLNDMTGISIDLRIAMPLVLVGAGIWSIGKKGLMLESVPGWLLLWFAFDMFVKTHPGRTDVDWVPSESGPDGNGVAEPGSRTGLED
jgi:hypothetical protein